MFAFGLTLSGSAVAQTSITVRQPQFYNPAEKTIIKEYRADYPSTITCYDSPDSVTFIYSQGNMHAIEVSMKNYWVNDFVIAGNIVYFCGRTNRASSRYNSTPVRETNNAYIY